MRIDYHIHTPYCGHAQGKIVEYIEEAVRRGFNEIGFADHLGRYYLSRSQKKRYWDWGMDRDGLDRYWSELFELRETYSREIAIRIGLEVDYLEGAEELLVPLLDAHPFDFYLASVHSLPRFGWRHLAELPQTRAGEMFEAYFDMVGAAAESGLFHSLSHLDFIWRYVRWPRSREVDVFALIADTVARAKKADIAIEMNSNGFLWSQIYKVRRGDPFEFLMQQIRQHDVPISLGSDAHAPRHVGKAFTQLVPCLKKNGFTEVSSFSGLKRRSVHLE